MTELYTGVPGSGKSLHAAKRIYDHLSKGGKVIANFEIDKEIIKSKKQGEFVYMDNFALDPKALKELAMMTHERKRDKRGRWRMIEGQTLLVLDECQILFDCREWQIKNRKEWCIFFTQHRKYGYSIVLVTPFARMIDRQIRSVVEFETKHRVVSNFKAIGFILGLLAGGKLFIAVRIWNGTEEKESASFFRLRRRYMELYDSYHIFTDTEDGVAEPGPRPPGPGKGGTAPPAAEPAPKPEEPELELLSAPDGLSWEPAEAGTAVV